jgi:hypothetical protein
MGEPHTRTRPEDIQLMEARARVRVVESRSELVAIVVVAASIAASLVIGKAFQLPELYAVTGLLTYYLGTKTGRPSKRRVENSLLKMPLREVESINQSVTARPPHAAEPRTVTFENDDGGTDG